MTSAGANAVQFTLACTCRRVNSGLIAGVPSSVFPFGGVHSFTQHHLPETRISVLQLAQRVKEIEVSMGKRHSAAQRVLCGRFPSSALVFSLSKVTLKAARHAGNPAYLFNMQTFAEPTSAVLCYFRSLPLQRNYLGHRPTHYKSKLWFHI